MEVITRTQGDQVSKGPSPHQQDRPKVGLLTVIVRAQRGQRQSDSTKTSFELLELRVPGGLNDGYLERTLGWLLRTEEGKSYFWGREPCRQPQL